MAARFGMDRPSATRRFPPHQVYPMSGSGSSSVQLVQFIQFFWVSSQHQLVKRAVCLSCARGVLVFLVLNESCLVLIIHEFCGQYSALSGSEADRYPVKLPIRPDEISSRHRSPTGRVNRLCVVFTRVVFSPPARFPRCRVARRRRATRVGRPRARPQRDANPTRGSPSRTSTARRGFRGARAASGVESPRDSASPGSAVHAESRGPGTGFLCWEGRRGPERA